MTDRNENMPDLPEGVPRDHPFLDVGYPIEWESGIKACSGSAEIAKAFTALLRGSTTEMHDVMKDILNHIRWEYQKFKHNPAQYIENRRIDFIYWMQAQIKKLMQSITNQVNHTGQKKNRHK